MIRSFWGTWVWTPSSIRSPQNIGVKSKESRGVFNLCGTSKYIKKNSKIIWVWTVPKKNYYDFPNVWTVSEPEENHKGRVKLWSQRGWDLTARSHFGPATMLLPSTGKSPYLLFIVHTCVHTLPTLRTYIPTYLDTCIPNMPTYLPTYRIRTYIHNRIFTYAHSANAWNING